MVLFSRLVLLRWGGGESSGFEVLLNRSFCNCDFKSSGLMTALTEVVLHGYENVL